VSAVGAGDDLDLTGVAPADRIDRLTAYLATTEAVKRAVLRCPTLEGRLRKLERWASRPKPRGFADDAPDLGAAREDDRLAALPDAVREAVERDQKSEDSRAYGRALADAALAIQWQAPPQPPIDLRRARQLLDESHAHLEEVKEAIADVLGMLEWRRKRGLPPGSGDMTALALIGPPGVGKTSVAISIAAATGRQLETFALSGMDDVFLSGVDSSYMHARPGEFMRRLMHGEHPSRWVAVLDEIDKIDVRPPHSPLATLLAILDPSQSRSLQIDHCYEALRVDLTGVLWICTGNDASAIPAPLLDRMRVLHIPAYTREEQVAIGRDYLLPRLLKDNDIDDEVLQLPEETVAALVTGYPPSEGMRPLEQRLTTVVRRALRHHLDMNRPIRVTPDLARSWLPSGEPERRIGFQVQPAGVTPRAGQARVVGRAPAVSPRRRLRRSSPRAPETSPPVSTGGGQP
jgi:ATP-dependent Lon protease